MLKWSKAKNEAKYKTKTKKKIKIKVVIDCKRQFCLQLLVNPLHAEQQQQQQNEINVRHESQQQGMHQPVMIKIAHKFAAAMLLGRRCFIAATSRY